MFSDEAREFGGYHAREFAAWVRRVRPVRRAAAPVGPPRVRLTLSEEAERRHRVVMEGYETRLRGAFGEGEFLAVDVRRVLGLHESSVKKVLRKLTDEGVVVRVRQVRTGERGGLPWVYRVGTGSAGLTDCEGAG